MNARPKPTLPRGWFMQGPYGSLAHSPLLTQIPGYRVTGPGRTWPMSGFLLTAPYSPLLLECPCVGPPLPATFKAQPGTLLPERPPEPSLGSQV